MATISVKEITGAKATGELQTGKREYTRLYRVITDSKLDSALQVCTSTGIPRLGDIYSANGSFDSTAVVLKIDGQQDGENPQVWVITVDYGPPNVDTSNGQNNPNPLLRPAVVSFGFNKSQRIVTRYVDGRPICNSAGDEFNPPLTVDCSNPVLTVSRNEPVFNPAIAVAYQDAVNSDGFFGAAPGCAKVAGISAVSQTENNYFFWEVTYQIEFRWDGWQPILLDYGRNAFFQDPDTQEIFKAAIWKRDHNGKELPNVPIDEPAALDGFGNELTNPTPQTIVSFPVICYRSLPFSQLGLP
jgi:hypothetical protein